MTYPTFMNTDRLATVEANRVVSGLGVRVTREEHRLRVELVGEEELRE